MKSLAALLLLSITTSAFSCADFSGDYVCEDKYSYSYYRHISIKDDGDNVIISENGRNKYNRILKLDGKKSPIEDMTIKSSCSGKVLKVTMALGRFSSTDKYTLTKSGLKFSTEEETGRKNLKCKRQ